MKLSIKRLISIFLTFVLAAESIPAEAITFLSVCDGIQIAATPCADRTIFQSQALASRFLDALNVIKPLPKTIRGLLKNSRTWSDPSSVIRDAFRLISIYGIWGSLSTLYPQVKTLGHTLERDTQRYAPLIRFGEKVVIGMGAFVLGVYSLLLASAFFLIKLTERQAPPTGQPLPERGLLEQKSEVFGEIMLWMPDEVRGIREAVFRAHQAKTIKLWLAHGSRVLNPLDPAEPLAVKTGHVKRIVYRLRKSLPAQSRPRLIYRGYRFRRLFLIAFPLWPLKYLTWLIPFGSINFEKILKDLSIVYFEETQPGPNQLAWASSMEKTIYIGRALAETLSTEQLAGLIAQKCVIFLTKTNVREANLPWIPLIERIGRIAKEVEIRIAGPSQNIGLSSVDDAAKQLATEYASRPALLESTEPKITFVDVGDAEQKIFHAILSPDEISRIRQAIAPDSSEFRIRVVSFNGKGGQKYIFRVVAKADGKTVEFGIRLYKNVPNTGRLVPVSATMRHYADHSERWFSNLDEVKRFLRLHKLKRRKSVALRIFHFYHVDELPKPCADILKENQLIGFSVGEFNDGPTLDKTSSSSELIRLMQENFDTIVEAWLLTAAQDQTHRWVGFAIEDLKLENFLKDPPTGDVLHLDLDRVPERELTFVQLLDALYGYAVRVIGGTDPSGLNIFGYAREEEAKLDKTTLGAMFEGLSRGITRYLNESLHSPEEDGRKAEFRMLLKRTISFLSEQKSNNGHKRIKREFLMEALQGVLNNTQAPAAAKSEPLIERSG